MHIDAADHRNQSSVGHLGHRSLLFGLLGHRCGDVWNDGWISLCLLSKESLSQKQNVRKISLDLFCVRNGDCRIGSARNHDTSVVMTAVEWGKLVLILAASYVFAGMAISLALTRSPWPVPLVYGVDLAAAATGCLAVLAFLTIIDSVSAWLLVGGLGGLAQLSYSGVDAPPQSGADRGAFRMAKSRYLCFLLATISKGLG